MPIRFADLETARKAPGLRLVLLTSAPSPWSDAVIALAAAKKLEALAVRMQPGVPEIVRWSRVSNAPAALFEEEIPRSGWAEILALLERLAPGHVPAGDRVELFGLAHELLGERGLAWARRAMLISRGLSTQGREGLPPQAAQFLLNRYGHAPDEMAWARERCLSLLQALDQRLANRPLFYQQLSALDVYCAACVNALLPLPESVRPLSPMARAAFGWLDPAVAAAISPALRSHRDRLAHLFQIDAA